MCSYMSAPYVYTCRIMSDYGLRTSLAKGYLQYRLITPSSITSANHTPHIRPHTVLSIFNCILSPTTSQPPLFLFLYTTTSNILSPHSFLFYPSQSFNPKPCMFCKHTHSHLYSLPPTLFSHRPLPHLLVNISHHALYL